MRQIDSISVYIRVFYDYPVEKNKDNRNWETSNNLMSDSNVNRGKRSKYIRMYNEEKGKKQRNVDNDFDEEDSSWKEILEAKFDELFGTAQNDEENL